MQYLAIKSMILHIYFPLMCFLLIVIWTTWLKNQWTDKREWTNFTKHSRKFGKLIEKPWGWEWLWAHQSSFAAKILHIEKGKRLSKQFHEKKVETILVLRGTLILELNNIPFEMKEGSVFHIDSGTVHRMIGKTNVDLIEVSTPELNDVIRLEDDFGREQK